jgi:hypothetical protein
MLPYRFERLENGDVLLTCGGQQIRIPLDHWCSTIAQMSYYGEEDYGYYRAKNFHAGEPIHHTCPLVEKTPPESWKRG